MNVHQSKRSRNAGSVVLLCSGMLIGTLVLPAQTAYVRAQQSEKSGSVSSSAKRVQMELKKFFEVAYDRHKLRFVSDDELIAGLNVPGAWQHLPANRVLDEMENFLKRHNLLLKKLSDQQYVIVQGPKPGKPVIVQEKKIPEPIVSLPVSGMVKDKAGTLQGGVSITEKGTRNATATDANGLFKLDVANEDAILEITAVGYKTIEMKVQAGVQMVIELEQKTEELNEVSVVAYGRKKKITVE